MRIWEPQKDLIGFHVDELESETLAALGGFIDDLQIVSCPRTNGMSSSVVSNPAVFPFSWEPDAPAGVALADALAARMRSVK